MKCPLFLVRLILFNYGKSYLERIGDEKLAIAAYDTELPLKPGERPLLDCLSMPGCIRDVAPDAWGRSVIINKKLGRAGTDTGQLDELTYLLESGSGRIGALDFQLSATEYVPRLAKTVWCPEMGVNGGLISRGLLVMAP